MSTSGSQSKAKNKKRKPRKRRQLTITPLSVQELIGSDESTIPLQTTGDSGAEYVDDEGMQVPEAGDITLHQMENLDSDSGSITDIEDENNEQKETDPLRQDRPINRDRWNSEEVDALMTALNVNRQAVKFHFDGPGGGKEVKRQGWRDVACYVNDTADTHRTVRQCRDKADDYTQRVKAKYNKLRFTLTRTGTGPIKDSLKLKDTEQKALDYLREEAVKGIPGIQVMSLPEDKKFKRKIARENKSLLWGPDRENKPEYEKVEMKREGVPKNYRDKNKRRIARQEKEIRRKENAIVQRRERKQERKEAREHRREKIRQKEESHKMIEDEARKERKKQRAALRERKRKRAEKRKAKASSEIN